MQVAFLYCEPQNPRSEERGFFIFAADTTSFAWSVQHPVVRSENIISIAARGTNEVM